MEQNCWDRLSQRELAFQTTINWEISRLLYIGEPEFAKYWWALADCIIATGDKRDEKTKIFEERRTIHINALMTPGPWLIVGFFFKRKMAHYDFCNFEFLRLSEFLMLMN